MNDEHCITCNAAPLPAGALLCAECRADPDDDGPEPWTHPHGRRSLVRVSTTPRAWLTRRCRGCGDPIVEPQDFVEPQNLVALVDCAACRQWGA